MTNTIYTAGIPPSIIDAWRNFGEMHGGTYMSAMHGGTPARGMPGVGRS